MIHSGAFRVEARGRADFRSCVRLRTATRPHEVARTVFVCPACEEILCINFLFPFIVFLTQQQQVDIYELKMQTPEQWEHRDSCGGGQCSGWGTILLKGTAGRRHSAITHNGLQMAAVWERGFPPYCRFSSGQELCRNSSDSYKW